jgi:hypothetical protein
MPNVTPATPVAAASPTTAAGLGTLSSVNQPIPMQNTSMGNLNAALGANAGAYTGLANQMGQQYQQNVGNVQQNLVNSGLGNTTVAQNMQQAPLQTYNNSMLNLQGQQQAQAANIYGQGAGQQNQLALAQMNNAAALQRQQQQIQAGAASQGAAMAAASQAQSQNQLNQWKQQAAQWDSGGGGYGMGGTSQSNGGAVQPDPYASYDPNGDLSTPVVQVPTAAGYAAGGYDENGANE